MFTIEVKRDNNILAQMKVRSTRLEEALGDLLFLMVRQARLIRVCVKRGHKRTAYPWCKRCAQVLPPYTAYGETDRVVSFFKGNLT